jgi:hypothetical protein
MKTYVQVDVQSHAFLNSALVGDEWSPLRPGRFTSGESVPGTNWIGGRVSPCARLEYVERKKLAPTGTRFLTLRPSSP